MTTRKIIWHGRRAWVSAGSQVSTAEAFIAPGLVQDAPEPDNDDVFIPSLTSAPSPLTSLWQPCCYITIRESKAFHQSIFSKEWIAGLRKRTFPALLRQFETRGRRETREWWRVQLRKSAELARSPELVRRWFCREMRARGHSWDRGIQHSETSERGVRVRCNCCVCHHRGKTIKNIALWHSSQGGVFCSVKTSCCV